MNKLLLTFFAVVTIALAGNQALAQQQKVSPAKEALIKELLEVSGSTKAVTDVSAIMMAFQRAESQKQMSAMIDEDKKLSAEEKVMLKQETAESIDRVTKRVGDFFTKEIDLDSVLLEIATPVYDQNFSENELRDLIAFYRSSTGQKVISLMPKLMAETMDGFSKKVVPKLEEFLKKTTDEEFAAIKQKVEQEMSPKKPKSKL